MLRRIFKSARRNRTKIQIRTVIKAKFISNSTQFIKRLTVFIFTITDRRDDSAYSRGVEVYVQEVRLLWHNDRELWLDCSQQTNLFDCSDSETLPRRQDLIHNIFRMEKEKEIISSFQSWKLKSMETSRLFFFYLKIV